MAEKWPGQEWPGREIAPTANEWPGQEWPGQEMVAEPQPKPMGTMDYLGRKVSQGAAQVTGGGSMLLGGLAGALGMDGVRDKLFDTTVGMNDMSQNAEIGVGTNDALQSGGERFAGAVAGAAPMIGAMLVNPALGIGLSSMQSAGDAADNLSKGLSTSATAKTMATDMAGNVVGMALPAGFGKTAKQVLLSAAPANVAQGAATDYIKNQIVAQEDKQLAQKYDPTNLEARAIDALLGAAGGYAASRPMRRNELAAADFRRRLDEQNARLNPEVAPVEPKAQQAGAPMPRDMASQIDPEAPPEAANSLRNVVGELREKLMPTPDAEAPDLSLIPKGDQNNLVAEGDPAYAPRAPDWTVDGIPSGPNRVLGDGELRDIAKTFGMDEAAVMAMPREAQIALRDHADNYQGARSSFGLADRRQRQVDADLANRGEMNPDYQGGGAAASGGRFDGGKREVTLYGDRVVTILESGQGKNGDQTIIGYEGPDGEMRQQAVPTKDLETFEVPVNQRMAQDYMQRSSEPMNGPRKGEGVGVGTMADEKMPRRSTDQISGDEVGGRMSAVRDPYNSPPRDAADGTVMPPEPTAGGPIAQRRGNTYEGEMPRADFAGEAPQGIAGPRYGNRPTPLPARETGNRTQLLEDNNAPSGDTRFVTDSQGRMRDREQTSTGTILDEGQANNVGRAKIAKPEGARDVTPEEFAKLKEAIAIYEKLGDTKGPERIRLAARILLKQGNKGFDADAMLRMAKGADAAAKRAAGTSEPVEFKPWTPDDLYTSRAWDKKARAGVDPELERRSLVQINERIKKLAELGHDGPWDVNATASKEAQQLQQEIIDLHAFTRQGNYQNAVNKGYKSAKPERAEAMRKETERILAEAEAKQAAEQPAKPMKTSQQLLEETADAMFGKTPADDSANNVQKTTPTDGKITIETEVEGKKVKVTADAAREVAAYDSRLNALEALRKCLSK
jgi:hypothetical protein